MEKLNALYLGRFQIFHKGHLEYAKFIDADPDVGEIVITVGSAQYSRLNKHPDLPWILQRLVQVALPSFDAYDLRLYAIVQASLFFCLLLSLALAMFSTLFWRTFAILGINSIPIPCLRNLLHSIKVVPPPRNVSKTTLRVTAFPGRASRFPSKHTFQVRGTLGVNCTN